MSYQPPYQNNGGTGNTQPQIGSFGPPQGAGNQGGNPNMGYQPPQPGYGAPSGPPGNAGYGSPSTAYGQPGQSYSNMNQGPSNYNSGPPPPGGLGSMPPTGGPPNMGGPPGPGLVQPPPNRAAFFSTASGAPIPSGPTMGGPPSSTGGGPGPPSYGGMPPTGSMGGPPMSGPAGANNPATFYSPANPVGGPPGAQGDYNSPQQYGAPSSTHGMPSAFGANNDIQNQRQQPPGGNAFGGGQSWGGGGNGNANSQKEHNNFPEQGNFPNSLPLINDMDLSITCNPAFIQSTVSKLVVSSAAATASKIPLGNKRFLTFYYDINSTHFYANPYVLVLSATSSLTSPSILHFRCRPLFVQVTHLFILIELFIFCLLPAPLQLFSFLH